MMTLSYWCAAMLETIYQIKPSKIACTLFCLLLIASWLVVLNCALTIYTTFLCVIFLLVGTAPLYKQLVTDSTLTLQALPKSEWLISCNQSKPLVGRLAKDSVVTPYFILMRLHCFDKTRSFVILRDSFSSGDFKKLLLRLMTT
jgi:hypothetical protein